MIHLAAAILATVLNTAAPQHATLLFAGDAMMHKGQLAAARALDGSYDFSEYFSFIAPQISSADYAVVNLETPLGGAPYSGYPCFCAPDSYADALKEAGFDMCLTANNHTLDRRDRGLRRTTDVLTAKGIDHVGTYRNSAQRDSILPLIKDISGIRVGFLNYTYGTNGIKIQGDVVVDYIERDCISRDIRRTRDAGAEIVCVAIHWGEEYKLLPNRRQRQLADFLVAEGADMVIGGHPHVIQPMEMRRDSITGRKHLVVYSLGNFISDMKTTDTRGGALVTAYVSRDSNGTAQVDSASYNLVFTEPGRQGASNFRLVYADSCTSTAYKTMAQAFTRSARKIFAEHNIDVPERTCTPVKR